MCSTSRVFLVNILRLTSMMCSYLSHLLTALLEESNKGPSEKAPQFLYDEYGEHLDHITASRLWNMVEGVMLHAREGTRGPRLPSVFIKSVVLDRRLYRLTLFPVRRMEISLSHLFGWGRGVIPTSSTCCEYPRSPRMGYLLR